MDGKLVHYRRNQCKKSRLFHIYLIICAGIICTYFGAEPVFCRVVLHKSVFRLPVFPGVLKKIQNF